MLKSILLIVVPFVLVFGLFIVTGFPLGQAVVSGIGGSFGLYLGQFTSKGRAANKQWFIKILSFLKRQLSHI